MSRQDKATTERHTRQLRELVKRPENKTCSDCKHNDPRWASWNLGVFLCIRCSGIHRGMGTHISKVKSIDLDTWTPEQMESITKWGNKRANLYWEAHLRPGHIPADHKMESFIRSKYESRRWAMDGPPPRDPSVLEGNEVGSTPEPPAAAAPPPPTAHSIRSVPSRSQPAPPVVSPVTTRQPQAHQLLSSQHVRNQSAARAAPPPADLLSDAPTPSVQKAQQQQVNAPNANNDLFSLDFHAPAAAAPVQDLSANAPKKDVKNDILSLFSTPSTATTAAPIQQQQFGGFQQAGVSASPWGAPAPPFSNAPTQTAAPNVGFNVWSQPSTGGAAPAQANMWGQPAQSAQQAWGQPQPPQQQPSLLDSGNVWASSSNGSGVNNGLGGLNGGADIWGSSTAAAPAQKKNDAFGDLWGGFK